MFSEMSLQNQYLSTFVSEKGKCQYFSDLLAKADPGQAYPLPPNPFDFPSGWGGVVNYNCKTWIYILSLKSRYKAYDIYFTFYSHDKTKNHSGGAVA